MSVALDAVQSTIESFILRAKGLESVDLDAPLYTEEGIGLDSLETAELSATLEDEYGHDPYSNDLLPGTVREILDYYATAA
jgi:acyl carrier protein